jgi:Ser/Thr protein kinase RdoA (MazF antagonist)
MQALQHFPLEPEDIELVAHSENVTFRVSARDHDSDYVLRLHRPGYNSIEELDSERLWCRVLSEAGIPVPEPLLTRQGDNFVLIDIPGVDEQRYSGMTRWLEGLPLCDCLAFDVDSAERARIFGRIGEIAAATHNRTTGWSEPPGFSRPRLDLDGLLGEAPHWGRFWEHDALTPADKVLLLRTRERLRKALSNYGAHAGNFSLIHSDMNPDNIVYDKGKLALIDFDDSAYGWHMYDIASALIDDRYAADFDAVCDALIDGYRKCRPLSKQDIGMLPAFLLIRGMAIIGWYHERPEHGGSEFFEDIKRWVIKACESNEW